MASVEPFEIPTLAESEAPASEFSGPLEWYWHFSQRNDFQTDSDQLHVLEGLEKLWKAYADRGLVVVGFPSNEFGGQDPGSNDEIASFCELNYGVSFPMMAKVKINGAEAHPLWQWLKSEAPGLLGTQGIKWNFTKFLVGKDGQVLKRYAPNDTPESMKKDIETALAA